MRRPRTHRSAPARSRFALVSWVLITLGTAAVALGAWDLFVEQDGDAYASLLPLAIGGVVIAVGLSRRRAQLSPDPE